MFLCITDSVMIRDGAREEMLGGQKPSERGQRAKRAKFLRTTPLSLAKIATTLSKNITSKLGKCRQCTEFFKNSRADLGLSEFSGGGGFCPSPKHPGRAIPGDDFSTPVNRLFCDYKSLLKSHFD